jgi:hypothetical protein
MSPMPAPSAAPENILADKFLSRFPRVGFITAAELNTGVNWNDRQEANLYDNYFDIALDILEKAGYITYTKSVGFYNPYETKLSLTNAGRALQDAGGYIKALKEKKAEEAAEKTKNKATREKVIFDNKVKYTLYVIAILAALVGIVTLWEKYSSDSGKLKPETQSKPEIKKPGDTANAGTTNDSIRIRDTIKVAAHNPDLPERNDTPVKKVETPVLNIDLTGDWVMTLAVEYVRNMHGMDIRSHRSVEYTISLHQSGTTISGEVKSSKGPIAIYSQGNIDGTFEKGQLKLRLIYTDSRIYGHGLLLTAQVKNDKFVRGGIVEPTDTPSKYTSLYGGHFDLDKKE